MSDLYDSACLRTVQAQASARCGDDGWTLMQRAGQAAWSSLRRHWPQAGRVLVLAGAGNNGGDGYVLARLALQDGCAVQVLALADAGPGTALARRACADYLACAGQLRPWQGELPVADVVVDALLGLGLSRAPQGELAALIEQLNSSGMPVLSIDLPSGVMADSGDVPGAAVQATRTVAMLLPSVGLYTGAALNHAGQVELAGLEHGLDLGALLSPRARRVSAADLGALLPRRQRDWHKGRNGHVLLLGGNHGMGGAVLLAARAALRSGAGLASVATRAPHVPALLANCAELMGFDADEAELLDARLQAASVLALGPGLGSDDWARALYAQVLAGGLPCVLDADALNLLAGAPQPLAAAVITPHPGEAARLLGCTTAQVQADRPAALQALVQRYQCVVVLKGAGSLVGAPGALPWLVDAGNPGMAVGGMGDVLTGVIAALMAQGLEPLQAARAGTLMHAVAGDLAAGAYPCGMMPSDLLPHLRVLANPEDVS
jgi:ADP-dependent NAD(P)H-hydrate dehydratase / NAD(P)H-hydrate epimerase